MARGRRLGRRTMRTQSRWAAREPPQLRWGAREPPIPPAPGSSPSHGGRSVGTPRSGRRVVLQAACAAAIGLGLGLAAPGARADEAVPLQNPAQETITVELLVLHVTNDGKGIDKDLEDMPELKRPPFSSYNSYKALSRERITLRCGGSTEGRKLPNDRQLAISCKGKKDQKYQVNVAIQK